MRYLVAMMIIFSKIICAEVIIDLGLQCSCEELNEADCNLNQFCTWNSSCVQSHLVTDEDSFCSMFGHEFCSNTFTDKVVCIYRSDKIQESKCIKNTHVCSEFQSDSDCNMTLRCYWNKNSKCATFSKCSDYDQQHCYVGLGCKAINGACTEFKCSDFTAKVNCDGEDQNGKCLWGDNNQCQSVEIPLKCYNLSNFKSECEEFDFCKYDNNVCRRYYCSEYSREDICSSRLIAKNKSQLCIWNNNKCQDAEDTSSFTQDTCHIKTKYTYKWTSNGKCEKCSKFVDYESYYTYFNISNNGSNNNNTNTSNNNGSQNSSNSSSQSQSSQSLATLVSSLILGLIIMQ